MGYMKIQNLYRDQRILDYKECYALDEKVARLLGWNFEYGYWSRQEPGELVELDCCPSYTRMRERLGELMEALLKFGSGVVIEDVTCSVWKDERTQLVGYTAPDFQEAMCRCLVELKEASHVQ